MANVIRSSADEVQSLPRSFLYARLLRGLDRGHDGWAFTRTELMDDGIGDDVVAVLGAALGRSWRVEEGDAGEVVMTRMDDIPHARAAVEHAFREPAQT